MKTSAIASILFAGAAFAAPVNEKRGAHTEVVVTTIWTTTTIFVDGPTRGVFAEIASVSASSSASSSSVSSAPLSSSAAPAAPSPVVAAVKSVAPVAVPSAVPSVAPVAAAPAAAAPATGSGPSGVGDVTYYTVSNGAAGSCGSTKTDNDNVVALSTLTMNNGGNSNNNPLCGKTINIQGESGVFQGVVYDTCEGCSSQSIDLSPSLFKAAFPNGDGRVHNVKWWVS